MKKHPNFLSVLLFILFLNTAFAKPKYLLVFCNPPNMDTIWNHESWLHKKDTTFVLKISVLPIKRYYVYRYNFKTESHLIICYRPGHTNRSNFDFMDTSNPYYTFTLKLRKNKLVKDGYFTWYLRFPMIDFYKNNHLEKRIVYYKPKINMFRYPVLRQKSEETFYNANISRKLIFDTLGQILQTLQINNGRIKYSSKENNILKPNDFVFENQFDNDTLRDIAQILEQESDTSFLLRCDTFINTTILVQHIQKQGENIKLIKKRYYETISDQSLSNTDIVTGKCYSRQYSKYVKYEYYFNYGKHDYKNKYQSTKYVTETPSFYSCCVKDDSFSGCTLTFKTGLFNRITEVIYDENNAILRKSKIKNEFYVKHKYSSLGRKKMKSFSALILLEISNRKNWGTY